MSFRNLFIIYSNDKVDNSIFNKISEICNLSGYGFIYKPKRYQDELISKIKDCNYYFTITEGPNIIECDEIFSLEEAFVKSLSYSKKEQRIKEQEFLQEQFIFLDIIVNLLFSVSGIKKVEFYASSEVSNLLEDYFETKVFDRCLSKAISNSYLPRKKEKYIGFKTTKFIIE